MKQSIALIGPGRVGCAVSKHLHRSGYPITAIIGRNCQRAEECCSYIGCDKKVASEQLSKASTAQIILLAVPDDYIQNSALTLQTSCHFTEQTTIIHFSGLHSAEVMRHRTSPARLLSLHPLSPFADRQQAYKNLPQCPCSIESTNPVALSLGEELITSFGGSFIVLDCNKKPLYHTAASIASNYLVTLLATARDLFISCGIEPDQAIPMLLPLVQASLDNVKTLGPEQGLSGPIVRGDIGTVAKQVKALKNEAPELLQLYLQMGKLTTAISQKSGRLTPGSASKMNAFFSLQLREAVNDCGRID